MLVEALAEYYHVKPGQVFVGVGSDDVISMAYMTFFNGDKPILFPDMTYSFYDVWANLHRVPFKTCALTEDWHISPGGLQAAEWGNYFPESQCAYGGTWKVLRW